MVNYMTGLPFTSSNGMGFGERIQLAKSTHGTNLRTQIDMNSRPIDPPMARPADTTTTWRISRFTFRVIRSDGRLVGLSTM